jgi:ankyrin repeat protein
VELLLEKGAEVNRIDEVEHWTALMFAGGEGLTEVIRTLLRHGADPNLKDTDGDTALTFAQRNGHEAVAGLLKGAMRE